LDFGEARRGEARRGEGKAVRIDRLGDGGEVMSVLILFASAVWSVVLSSF
jgi:hypothetical protein